MYFGELRNEAKLVFVPVDQITMDNAVQLIRESRDMRNRLVSSSENSIYQQLRFESGNKITSFDLNLDDLRQFTSPFGITDEAPEGDDFQQFGIAFIPEGLQVSPKIEFEGQEFETFAYSEENHQFVLEINGQRAIIEQTNAPSVPDIRGLRTFVNASTQAPYFIMILRRDIMHLLQTDFLHW